MTIQPLVDEARRLLKQNPRDDIHDLTHHLRVLENAQTIAKTINQQIDKDVLQVAVMWHDVMITDKSLALGEKGILEETVAFLEKIIGENKYPDAFRHEVIHAIRHHSFFTKLQMNVEGKILFDADKLDALTPVRYKRIIAAIKNKKISKFQTFLYASAAKIWLKTMRGKYHFDISRKMHDERIEVLLKDKEAIQVAKGLGVDIVKLVK